MASKTITFFCSECGYESAKWLGRCPSCSNWNTFTEELVNKSKSNLKASQMSNFLEKTEIKKLSDIKVEDSIRIDTGFSELNRVFGSGIVKGSISLIGGEPGIGKSTIIMQVCSKLAEVRKSSIYIRGRIRFTSETKS